MTRNRLYLVILIACLAGYLYLFYQLYAAPSGRFTVCLFKNITGYACPSCGTTRAVVLLSKGDVAKSLLLNPFGIIVAGIMLVCPVWITADYIRHSNSFYESYKKMERKLRRPTIAVAVVLLVLANWIWNLYKHL